MNARRRSAIALAAGLAAIPGAALAAPAPFEGLHYWCPGYGGVVLVSPGNGAFTPGFIDGTNGLLVPYAVRLTVVGPAGTQAVDEAKSGPVPDGAIACTIDTTINVGGSSYTFTGSVIGVVEGRP